MNENFRIPQMQFNERDLTKIAHQIQAINGRDVTPAEIKRAIKKYKTGISTHVYALQQVFTTTNQTGTVTQTVDGMYGFFLNQITVQVTSTDTNQYLTAFQISGQTSLITGNIPLLLFSRLTGMFQPFFQYFPPNSNIVASFQNGGTTSANTIDFTLFGYWVPVGMINELSQGQYQ